MKKTTLIALATPLILGGCAAGFEEDFTCNKVGGVPGCTSMADIRQNIDLYSQGQGTTSEPSIITANEVPNSFVALPRRDRFGQPNRTEEVTRKVTIFPFTANGAYVDTTDVYIILDDTHWTGRPVKAIQGD